MFDIHLRQVSLSYGDHPVFAHLDLTLKAGHWTCLLGGSGVGKTSLLRLVAGLIHQGETNTVQGTMTCSDDLPLQGRLAWMAQQDSLLPWSTVFENTTLGSRLRNTGLKLSPAVAEQAMVILERVGLADKANHLPQQLSGGQRQRVALARTLMEDQPVVLMDEPFAAVDAITRLNLQDLACELLQGKTVLLITHDPLEALRLGHEVYHLRGQPAQLTDALLPPGVHPRSLDDSELMALQGTILERLRSEELA